MAIRRMSEDQIKRVIDLLEDGAFPRDISLEIGISASSIRDIRDGKTYIEYTCGKTFPDVHRRKRPPSKMVIQKDVNGNVINTYLSSADAANALCVSKQCMSRYCRGERHHKQYIFEYAGAYLRPA